MPPSLQAVYARRGSGRQWQATQCVWRAAPGRTLRRGSCRRAGRRAQAAQPARPRAPPARRPRAVRACRGMARQTYSITPHARHARQASMQGAGTTTRASGVARTLLAMRRPRNSQTVSAMPRVVFWNLRFNTCATQGICWRACPRTAAARPVARVCSLVRSCVGCSTWFVRCFW